MSSMKRLRAMHARFVKEHGSYLQMIYKSSSVYSTAEQKQNNRIKNEDKANNISKAKKTANNFNKAGKSQHKGPRTAKRIRSKQMA